MSKKGHVWDWADVWIQGLLHFLTPALLNHHHHLYHHHHHPNSRNIGTRVLYSVPNLQENCCWGSRPRLLRRRWPVSPAQALRCRTCHSHFTFQPWHLAEGELQEEEVHGIQGEQVQVPQVGLLPSVRPLLLLLLHLQPVPPLRS